MLHSEVAMSLVKVLRQVIMLVARYAQLGQCLLVSLRERSLSHCMGLLVHCLHKACKRTAAGRQLLAQSLAA